MDTPPFNRVADYRSRAEQLRERASELQDEAVRQHMLETAALWDRMADYEEKNPTTGLTKY